MVITDIVPLPKNVKHRIYTKFQQAPIHVLYIHRLSLLYVLNTTTLKQQ